MSSGPRIMCRQAGLQAAAGKPQRLPPPVASGSTPHHEAWASSDGWTGQMELLVDRSARPRQVLAPTRRARRPADRPLPLTGSGTLGSATQQRRPLALPVGRGRLPYKGHLQ